MEVTDIGGLFWRDVDDEAGLLEDDGSVAHDGGPRQVVGALQRATNVKAAGVDN